jgi:copper chaperone
MAALHLTIPSMACAACAETIAQAVHSLDPAAVVEANPQTKAVVVNTAAAPESVKAAIAAAGYPVE